MECCNSSGYFDEYITRVILFLFILVYVLKLPM